MDVLGLVLIGAGLAACAVFVSVYLFTAGWPKKAEGRHLMTFTAAMGALFGQSLILQLIGEFPGADWVSVAIVVAIVGLLWQRVWLLVRAQCRTRHRKNLEAQEEAP